MASGGGRVAGRLCRGSTGSGAVVRCLAGTVDGPLGAVAWVLPAGAGRAVGICEVGLNDVGVGGTCATCAVGRKVGMCAVTRVAATAPSTPDVGSKAATAAVDAITPGKVMPGRPRSGIDASPSRAARSCSPLCGR